MQLTLDAEQQKAVERMASEPTRACLNASDTGVGKTLLSVELAKEIGAKTVLVIGPANPRVIDSWRRTFEGQGFPYPFQKIDRENYLSVDYTNPERGVYYVSKEFARRHDFGGNQDQDINWRKSRFDMVIADESHFSANRKAGVTKTLWNLRHAGYRLALSATPQGSNFAGFWSLCRFLWYDHPHPDATEDSPRWEKFIIDPSYHRWEAVWCDTETQYVGRGQQVKKVIGPKGDDPTAFIESLPCYVALKATRKPVEIREVSVTLTSEQRKIYDEMLSGAVAWLDENSVLTADYPMTKRIRLHQATLGYPIIDEENDTVAFDHSKESPKADAIQAIRDIEHPGERIVVFTSSEKFTRLLAERIPDAVLWTGPVSKKNREKNLEAFLEGTSKMLIATYPAISEGMDGLQHVCHVEIRADEAGSVVQETQVNGRLNRRGQKADKIIRYRLLAEDTADTERVEALIDNVRARRSEL